MSRTIEEHFYNELKDSPRPHYPFPDFVSPHMEELVAEYCQWIDVDCQFESEKARERHKRHRLSDLAARGFPWLTLEELRPVARFTAFFAILDDFMDRSSSGELQDVTRKVAALLTGQDDTEPGPGLFHQFYLIRQDAVTCGLPEHLYQQFVDSILALMEGYGEEKQYNAAGKPPPFPIFQSIRQKSSGGVCFAKYVCMQKNYRLLPDEVLLHPNILRMHELSGSLIGYHNDFISLPKELARKGDVVNLIITVQHESGLSLLDACREALRIHDADLDEFIQLQNSLPDFGPWQPAAQEYARDLGIMVQGVYSWHTKSSGRYVPGAYVEPEHKKKADDDKGGSRLVVGGRRKVLGFQVWQHFGLLLCLFFGLALWVGYTFTDCVEGLHELLHKCRSSIMASVREL
ncbi:isoprenoid synthase domain-containing protein [Dactylonectria macrodidyma]|uniref:Terpene synthase n=1 Tax=Dactylonectria macrodidyma TaxID=307937 RepID=A0A9P9ES19_9HYPO|nr:isoprenoid synthase domain-containing protein [Dactylonectria macrodidyma]